MGEVKLSQVLTSALKVFLSLGLLAFILHQVGWEQTWASVQMAQPFYLLVALSLYLIGVAVRAYRWQILLTALRMEVSLPRLTALYFIGAFFNSFLPTGIGGDVVRIYELAKQSERSAASVGTVLIARATGLLALFLMALTALFFSYRLITPALAIAIVLLCVVAWCGAVLILKRDWLEKWGLLQVISKVRQLEKVYESVHHCGPRAIGGALAVSLIFNALLITVNYFIALSLGVKISLYYFLLFIPIISFLLVLPISLSGLGIREGGYIYLFAQAGVPAHLALTMSLTFYALTVATGCIGGIIYALEGIYDLCAKRMGW